VINISPAAARGQRLTGNDAAGLYRFMADCLLHELAHVAVDRRQHGCRDRGAVYLDECVRITKLLAKNELVANWRDVLDKPASALNWPTCVRPADYCRGVHECGAAA
jgi:hypothetical protein